MRDKPHFDIKTTQIVRATPRELTALVLDPVMISRWAGRVFMNCEVVAPGDADGRGMALRVFSKGWMPHSFLINIVISDLEPDRWMVIEAGGDFDGQARIDVTAISNSEVRVDLHWRTDLDHPLLRYLARILRPILRLNHKWAVSRVARQASAEIARRRQGDAGGVTPKPSFPIWLRLMGKRTLRRARAKGWVGGPLGGVASGANSKSAD